MALRRLYGQLVAEEVASTFRHRLVNKLAAIGALTFHLKRQIAAAGAPVSVSGVPPLIDAEVSQASASLNVHFLSPASQAEATAVGAAIAAAAQELGGTGIEVSGDRALRVAVEAGELAVALFCLFENAIEAGGTVVVRVGAAPPHVLIDILDDGPGVPEEAREPFFTTRPGRLGLGLNVAIRVAQRYGGSLQLRARERVQGTEARLSLPGVST
jgi:signal transduction histidine kinase